MSAGSDSRSAGRARRRPGRAPARRAQPAPARGGHARRGAAAGARRRGLGQDAGAHPPDRLAAGDRARAADGDPRDHLHQQGGERDARAGREPDRRHLAGDVGDDLPLRLRPDPARRGPAARLQARLHDLRRGRLGADGQALPGGARARSEALPAALDQGGDLGGQEPAHRRRRLRDAAETDREQAVADVYNLYERRMVEASAMDFDDLLVRTVNLLELFADVREKYRRIFRWVLVDEYQDTNRAQYRMLQLLTEEHRNLTVVGDDFQARLLFRGADIRNILEFERDFPDATTVLLEQNYRSTQTILDAANGADRPQREPEGEAPVDRRRARGADRRRRVRRRARRGALRRLGDQPAGRGGDAPRPDRGLLPDERAEPGARGHAGAVRDPLPGDRRDEVLRAGRDQGRGRLPAAARQPRRRDLVRAGRQLAAARDRPADPGADPLAREHDRRPTSGTCSPTRPRSRRWARRR